MHTTASCLVNFVFSTSKVSRSGTVILKAASVSNLTEVMRSRSERPLSALHCSMISHSFAPLCGMPYKYLAWSHPSATDREF
jgi:hypothetical protein